MKLHNRVNNLEKKGCHWLKMDSSFLKSKTVKWLREVFIWTVYSVIRLQCKKEKEKETKSQILVKLPENAQDSTIY